MELTPTLIKYLVHKGVQLGKSRSFIDKEDINRTAEVIENHLKDLEEIKGFLKPISSNLYRFYHGKSSSDQQMVFEVVLAGGINLPPEDLRINVLLHTKTNNIIYYDTID